METQATRKHNVSGIATIGLQVRMNRAAQTPHSVEQSEKERKAVSIVLTDG
jgi:hypothetical protein